MDIGKIAGQQQDRLSRAFCHGRVQAGQRSLAFEYVRDYGEIKEFIDGRGIGTYADPLRDTACFVDKTLDEEASAEVDQALGPPHPPALPSGKDGADHVAVRIRIMSHWGTPCDTTDIIPERSCEKINHEETELVAGMLTGR